jgi:FkbM family methyltransferase
VTATRKVWINGRWPLLLPEHRAARPEWPWWEATRLAAMRTVIDDTSVVWDVGAEEGDFPALWASWGARVVMAEPNPRVWPNIALIWRANELPDPLLCWSGFLGAETDAAATVPGVAEQALAGRWPASADGPVIGDHGFCQLGERPDLPTTRIDWLVEMGAAPPTVLTMDVEGSELHVLRGAASTLLEHRPDVFVSIHPEFMEHHYGIVGGVASIRAFMRDHGYEEDRHVFLSIDHEHHWWFRP